MITKESATTFQSAPGSERLIIFFFSREVSFRCYWREFLWSFGRWCGMALERDNSRRSTGWKRAETAESAASATVSTKAVCPFTPTTPPSPRSPWTQKRAPTLSVTTPVTKLIINQKPQKKKKNLNLNKSNETMASAVGKPKNKNCISHFCLFNKANNHGEGKMSDEWDITRTYLCVHPCDGDRDCIAHLITYSGSYVSPSYKTQKNVLVWCCCCLRLFLSREQIFVLSI